MATNKPDHLQLSFAHEVTDIPQLIIPSLMSIGWFFACVVVIFEDDLSGDDFIGILLFLVMGFLFLVYSVREWWRILFFAETICTVTNENLTVRHLPIPLFDRQTVRTKEIKRVYVQERHLYAETKNGRSILLMKSCPRPESTADSIENFLWDRSQQRLEKPWKTLAQQYNLQFDWSNEGRPMTVAGVYQGYNITLSAAYDQKNKPYTEFYLSPSNQNTPSTDADPQLPWTSATLTELLQPHDWRARLSGDWGKVEGANRINEKYLTYVAPKFIADIETIGCLLDALSQLWHMYPQILAQPQAAVPVLQKLAMNQHEASSALARYLLEYLAEATQSLQNNYPDLLCQHCFHRFAKHTVNLSFASSVSYYGCRACHRTQDHITVRRVIAVLNETMKIDYKTTEQGFYLNWALYQDLFDFDEIRIDQISDEMLERFVVQVGNDTDPTRKAKYDQMCCMVTPSTTLSENSLRLLRQQFDLIVVRS